MSDHKDRRIEGQTTERRNNGTGIQVAEPRRRIDDGGSSTDDRYSIVPALGEQGKVRLLEVCMAEIRGLQDNPGGETLTSLKVVGQGSV